MGRPENVGVKNIMIFRGKKVLTKDEWEQKLRNDIRERGKIEGIAGIFGPELKESGGYVDSITKTENGITTKLYGCNYEFKGYPDKDSILKLELSKSILFGRILNETRNLPFVLFGIALNYIVFRKRTIRFIEVFFDDISHKVIQTHGNPYETGGKRQFLVTKEDYCPFVRNIHDSFTKNAEGKLSENIRDYVCQFLQLDITYRARLQDAKQKTIKETLRTLKRRETNAGMKKKWQTILTVYKILGKKADKVFAGIKEIPLDDDDRYFFYGIKSYDFNDLSWEKREKELYLLDKIAGNVKIRA